MSQTAQEVAVGFAAQPANQLKRVAALWSKLKAPPAGDVGAQRWRNIFISLGGAMGSRLLGFGCSLLMVPLALRSLGAERYGVWITLTSSVSLLSFFDFGLGIGLQNRVSEMMGKGRLEEVTLCLRSTLVVMLLISVGLFGVLTAIIYQTNLAGTFFHAAAFTTIDLPGVLVLIAGAFLIGLPLSLFPRMAFGLQQGWIASVAASCGAALSLLAVFAATLLQVNFTTFVAFTVVPPIAAQAIGYFILAGRVTGGLPLVGPVSLNEGLNTLKTGSEYVLPQIAGAIITQGPMVLLGTMSSPLDAASYNILIRISMPLQQLQQMFLVQIWPAITEAMHSGDTHWLHKTLRRIMRSTVIFSAFAMGFVALSIVLLFPLLTKNPGLKPSMLIILLFAAQFGVWCVVQGLSYMVNGLSLMRLPNYLAVISLIFAFSALPFAAMDFGTAGVLIALLALNGLIAIPLLYREYTQYLSRHEAL